MLIEANGVENTASRPNIHTVCHREVGPRIYGYGTHLRNWLAVNKTKMSDKDIQSGEPGFINFGFASWLLVNPNTDPKQPKFSRKRIF